MKHLEELKNLVYKVERETETNAKELKVKKKMVKFILGRIE